MSWSILIRGGRRGMKWFLNLVGLFAFASLCGLFTAYVVAGVRNPVELLTWSLSLGFMLLLGGAFLDWRDRRRRRLDRFGNSRANG